MTSQKQNVVEVQVSIVLLSRGIQHPEAVLDEFRSFGIEVEDPDYLASLWEYLAGQRKVERGQGFTREEREFILGAIGNRAQEELMPEEYGMDYLAGNYSRGQ